VVGTVFYFGGEFFFRGILLVFLLFVNDNLSEDVKRDGYGTT
jgi:hypothetical protein